MPTTNIFRLAAAALMTATGGPLKSAKVGLVAQPITPDQNTVLSELVQPTYTGYALAVITTWSIPYVAGDGLVHLDGGDVLFQMTDTATPTDVYGYFLVDTAGTGLLQVVLFDEPVPLTTTTEGVMVDVEYIYSGT